MRAILIATGYNPDMTALNERYPTPLLPLIDRPFIQHVVEWLVDQGVTEFDFVLSHLPEKIEHLLGDGTRWGSTFQFHLVRDPARPYSLLQTLIPHANDGNDPPEPLLLAHADRLPRVPLEHMKATSSLRAPTVVCWRQEAASLPEAQVWTGWAWLSDYFLAHLPSDGDESAVGAHLLAVARQQGTIIEVSQLLSVQSYEELLAAQRAVLSKAWSGLMLTGREVEQGIWLSRNVSLPPTARLIPPVYIGENCRIGEGVRLGPNVVVGHDCVLDTRCTVEDSVIFPGSYVGEALELANVIVDKNRLINVQIGAAVTVADNFILGSLTERRLQPWLAGIFSQLVALALLAVTWPLLVLTALWLKLTRPGPVLHKKEVVRLPAPSEETGWRTFSLWSFCPDGATEGARRLCTGSGLSDFFLHFLPGLINVARGELRFVGVPPRRREEIGALSQDWQALYLRAKAGLVTEADVHCGANPTDDELYAAEAFYSVTAGFRHDLKLLLGYMGRILTGFRFGDESRYLEAG